MSNSPKAQPYQVLAHTDNVLIVQTNAGTLLTTPADSTFDKTADNTTGEEPNQSNSFGQFNLGLHVNDDPTQVLHNRAVLLQLLNEYLITHESEPEHTHEHQHENGKVAAVEAIYWLNQIHSNQVIRVDANDQKALHKLSLTPPSADALVTVAPHQALAVMTADCVPIVVYDPNSQQVAAIHAGWQGLANGVIFETYHELNKIKGTVTGDKPLQAWIGACISQSCYEVSNDVVNKLLLGCENAGMNRQDIEQQIVGKHEDSNKAWLDLPKLAQLQLNQLGIEVVAPHAESSPLDALSETKGSLALACSYGDNSYYSYRRKTHLAEKNTGRMALLIVKLN